MYLPAIKPVWSLDIKSGNSFFNLFAKQADANLYVQLSNEMGLQFFKYCLSLLDFGIQVIIPFFWVTDNSLLLKPWLSDLKRK